MATVNAPQRETPRVWLPDYEDKLPRWLMRRPVWARIALFLFVLMAISLFIRTRYLSGEFWMNEALMVGISSHSLTAIPGVLQHDGSPPLFFWLLHIWNQVFGTSTSATHSLSLLFGMLAVPIGMWAGWSLFGTRAGVITAVLFAFSAFLTNYSQEAGMYSLMALLSLIGTTAFLHGFVYGRRQHLILFAAAQIAMLYTHEWALFYVAGAVVAWLLLVRITDGPNTLARDGLYCFLGSLVLFAPWLPTFIHQLARSTEPWGSSARYVNPELSLDVLGGDRVTVAMTVGTVVGVAPLVRRAKRRSDNARAVWALLLIPVIALGLAAIFSGLTPVWVSSYFGPAIGPLMLLGAYGMSRSGVIGAVALVLCVAFLADPHSFTPTYKSDVADISAEMTPQMHAGDLVITGQPEQDALMWYYLPQTLRFASTLGPTPDPTYMNWDGAYTRLLATKPATTLDPMVASLRPGQQLLYVRPLTEGEKSWRPAWTQLVRRRAAQWGAILQSDVNQGILRPIALAPHNYRGSCCVADSAVLYQKLS
jgi:mannosyltransferase